MRARGSAGTAMARLLTARFTVRIRAAEPNSDLDPPSQPPRHNPLVHEMCTERRDFYAVAMTGSRLGAELRRGVELRAGRDMGHAPCWGLRSCSCRGQRRKPVTNLAIVDTTGIVLVAIGSGYAVATLEQGGAGGCLRRTDAARRGDHPGREGGEGRRAAARVGVRTIEDGLGLIGYRRKPTYFANDRLRRWLQRLLCDQRDRL